MKNLVALLVAGIMLLSLSHTGHSLSVHERQVTEPPTCTDAGNPSTPVGMCYVQLTSQTEVACTGNCRQLLEQLATQCPYSGPAYRAAIDAVCTMPWDPPTGDFSDSPSGGSGMESGATAVGASLLYTVMWAAPLTVAAALT